MFIKKKIFIFLITFLFLNFATVTFAHADSYTLSGTVKDSSGNALVGATVSINDANNSSTLRILQVTILYSLYKAYTTFM